MKKTLFLLLGALLVAAFAPWAQAQSANKERCLSYWTVGMSGCGAPKKAEPKPEPEQKPAEQPELIEPQQPQQRPLAERIEEFRQNYDKPPTEFIAFNLEPSLENALRWVQKYNDMIQRSRQLSSAWSQAQQVYKIYQEQGIQLPPVDYVTELPPVPDYGLPVNPAFAGAFNESQTQQDATPWRNLNQNPNITLPGQAAGGGQGLSERDRNLLAMMQKMGLPPEALAGLKNPQSEMAAMAQMAQVPGMNMQAMMPNMGGAPSLPQAQPQQPQQREVRIGGGGGQSSQAAADGTIRLSYYFSAQCPYCRQFEPHISRLANENKNVRITCVDMTPSGQVATNVGNVDCEWRPLMPGEMDAYGVKTTPTLVIDRGGTTPLERLAGYVEYADLKRAVIK